MNTKKHKKYAVVDLRVFDREMFERVDRRGQLTTTSYDTMRKSVDGMLGIISWNTADPPNVPDEAIIWLFGHNSMVRYLDMNQEVWGGQQVGSPVSEPTEFFPRELPRGVRLEHGANIAWWIAAAGALAAAAYYFFG